MWKLTSFHVSMKRAFLFTSLIILYHGANHPFAQANPEGIPDKPTNFRVFSTGVHSLELAWSASAGASGYKIEQYADETWMIVKTPLQPEVTRTTLDSLTPGTSYILRIIAVGIDGESEPSELLEGHTRPAPPSGYDSDFPLQPPDFADVVTVFDVDWDQSPHSIGWETAIGAPAGPTSILFGSPTVGVSLGDLTQRPLMFNSSGTDNGYEQILFDLAPNRRIYTISMDVLVSSLGPNEPLDGFSILFDGAGVDRIEFKRNMQVVYVRSPFDQNPPLLGNYTLNEKTNLRIQFDRDSGSVSISLDGAGFVSIPTSIAADYLDSVRISLIDTSKGQANCAVDNVKIFALDGINPPVEIASDFPSQPGTVYDVVSYYDINWDGAPHQTGQTTAIGAPDAPSSMVGEPEVANSFGDFQQMPLVFDLTGSAETHEQIEMSLGKHRDVYYSEMDIFIAGFGGVSGTESLSVILDADIDQKIVFQSTGEVTFNSSDDVIAEFDFESIINLRVQMDRIAGKVFVSVDGAPFVERDANANGEDLSAIRIDFADTIGGGGSAAVDDVSVAGFNFSDSKSTAPTNLRAYSVGSHSVSLSWDHGAVTETGFVVESRSVGGSWEAVGVTEENVRNVSIIGLNYDSTYDFRVAAINAAGSSPYSNVITVHTPTVIPGVPVNFRVITETAVSITFAWDEDDLATNYDIFQQVGDPPVWQLKSSVGISSTAGIGGLDPSSEYSFAIRARNSYGDSGLSNPLFASTSEISPPSSIVATDGSGYTQIRISWSSAGGATSYDLYRSSDSSGLNPVFIESLQERTYYDSPGEYNREFYYSVRARGGNELSDFGDWVAAKHVLPVPTVPGNVQATLGSESDRVVIAWSGSGIDTIFRVFRSSTPSGLQLELGATAGKSWSDNNVSPGEMFYYSVVAENISGSSDHSDSVPGYVAFAPVTGLIATSSRYDGIALSWQHVEGATSYSIFRGSVNSPNGASLIGNTSENHYTDSSSESNKEVFYFIRPDSGEILGNITPSGATGIRLSQASFRPDALQGGKVGKLVGNDIYGATAASAKLSGKKSLKWFYRFENDGVLNDRLLVNASRGNKNFKVIYKGSAGNITSSLVAGGMAFPLSPSGRSDVVVQIKPTKSVRGKGGKLVIRSSVSSLRSSLPVDGVITKIKKKK